MPDNASTRSASWSALKDQWRRNLRLQAGVAVIVGLVWLWACLVGLDEAQHLREQAAADTEAALQLRPLLGQTQWPARADEAQRLLAAARELQWPATSGGAAEAKLQDELRSWAGKAGVNVVELSILAGSGGEAAQAPGGAAVRARLVTDLNRNALMALLAQLQGAQPMVIVDALKLRPSQAPARAEIELRIQMKPAAPEGAPA